ncbi:MAG: hypothetical protein N2422_07680 [Rhodobacteraceae bacterium]|nr:hypothetical protein [Paracoccaceae bacterium]
MRPRAEGRRALLIPVLTFAGTIAIMTVLGAFVVQKYRELQVRQIGEASSIFVSSVLTPYAFRLKRQELSPDDLRRELETWLAGAGAPAAIRTLNLWDIDGRLLISTDETFDRRTHEATELDEVMQTGTLISFDVEETGPDGHALFEVYVPIRDTASGRIVAVGEVYRDATLPLSERKFVEASIWAGVAAATLGLLILMSIVLAQQRQLELALEQEYRAARTSDALRKVAERARQLAHRANEQMLNSVGADIHDGPVQVLTLLAMGGPDDVPPDRREARARELAAGAIEDLRAIASGLMLPDIAGLTLAQTLDLAVAEFPGVTGEPVETRYGDLPDHVSLEVRTCLFRFVKEGLINAVRHSDGKGLRVEAFVEDGDIVVKVRNADGGRQTREQAGTRRGLGLLGLRNRFEVFDGSVSLLRSEAEGTTLVGRIPLARLA